MSGKVTLDSQRLQHVPQLIQSQSHGLELCEGSTGAGVSQAEEQGFGCEGHGVECE